MTLSDRIQLAKDNLRLDTEQPDTFPHVIESSIKATIIRGCHAISYLVNNGRTIEERGTIFTDMPE